MQVTRKHAKFELLCRTLIGLVFHKVEYTELIYDQSNPTPFYNTDYPSIHTVDFSVLLHSDHKITELCWTSEFFSYGVGLKTHDKFDSPADQLWDVSNAQIWKNVVGQKVTDVEVKWETVYGFSLDGKQTSEDVYPQDLILRFQNEQNMIVSAAEFISTGKVIGMMDNLLVTNDEVLAKEVGII